MPKGRSRARAAVNWFAPGLLPAGRVPRRFSRRAATASADLFDDRWLRQIQRRSLASRIDLTSERDRRFYHPDRIGSWPEVARGFKGYYRQGRVLIVPQHSRLAKYATYGQRYSLTDVMSTPRFGFDVADRLIICVRRQQRKEVLFANGGAGGGSRFWKGKVIRRTPDSNVRC